jgi:hypothetical protein
MIGTSLIKVCIPSLMVCSTVTRTLSAKGGSVCTINVLNPQLLCRSANRAKSFAQLTTSDADILRRRYLPIDLDAIRPARTSSSDEQHEAAIGKSRGVFKFISHKGLPEPIVLDSGNGAHLLMPFDEPSDQNTKTLALNILQALTEQFNDGSRSMNRPSIRRESSACRVLSPLVLL